MNERIRELAEQAKFETTTRTHVIDGPRQIFFGDAAVIQKFAELIIKECADIATINQYQSYTPGHYVLKHFGDE